MPRNQERNLTGNRWLWPVAIPLMLLLLTVSCGWWTAQRADLQLREDLLMQARLVRQSLNPKSIASLSDARLDQAAPTYRGLQSQLALIRHVNPKYRFIYLMGRRPDGQIFFYVDSEPRTSKAYSPPGQIYTEASPYLHSVFTAKAELVEGPFSDRWGTWISALVPIVDPPSGKLLAVMGMDVDARTWNWHVASQAVLPTSLMLTVAILLTSGIVVSRSQSQLRKSESHYKRLVENPGQAIVVIQDGLIRYANPTMSDLGGYSAQELDGRLFLDLIHPEDRCHLMETYQNRQVNLENYAPLYGIRCLAKDGNILWTEVHPIPIEWDGQPATLCFISDLTLQVAIKAALLETETKYRKIFDNIHDVFYQADLNGIFTEISPSIEKLLGYTREDVLGKPVEVVYYNPLDRSGLLEAVKAHGEVVNYELRLKHKSGQEINGSANSHIIVDADGAPVGIEGLVHDVTERKQAEEKLRQLSEVQSLILDNSSLGIALIRNRVFEWVNPRWSELFMIPVDQLQGASTRIMYPSEEAFDEMAQKAYPLLAQGKRSDNVIQLRRGDGSLFWNRFMGKALNPADPQNGGSIWMCEDITERKRAEEELRRSNQELASLVKTLENLSIQNHNLRELGGLLMSSSRIDDVLPVVLRSMKLLFPGTSGALFLERPDTAGLEAIVTWGAFPQEADENAFAPEDCWGMKRCGLHTVEDPDNGLPCRHVRHAPISAYACLPLMARSEVLGLLHIRLQTAARAPQAVPVWLEGVRSIAAELAELLSLSISNIRLREKLSAEASRDPLTKLYNRRYMEASFLNKISLAARNHTPIGVIMLDIDHFKQFNDRHGHAAGDAVLSMLAGFLKCHLRDSDFACRYGGEEFVLILFDSAQATTAERAGQIAVDLGQENVSFGGQNLGPITLSMGVAAYPQHGATPEDLLRAADTALYKAKQAGRNRIMLA